MNLNIISKILLECNISIQSLVYFSWPPPSPKCSFPYMTRQNQIKEIFSLFHFLLLHRFSHVRLCDPIDGSPPASPVPGILQARTLEWVATSFSNAWKWKGKMKSLSQWLTLSDPMDCSLPGKSTGVGCHCLLCFHFLNHINRVFWASMGFVLLKYKWHTINYTNLKCTIWRVLTYVHEIITIKIGNITISPKISSWTFVIPFPKPSCLSPSPGNHWFAFCNCRLVYIP